MKRLFLLIVLVILSAPNAASAQRQQSIIHAGTRVRLVVADTIDAATANISYTTPVGTVTGLDDRFLTLRLNRGIGAVASTPDTVTVPIRKIVSGTAFTGMRRHSAHGAIVGVVVGAITGFIVGNGGGDAARRCVDIGGTLICGNSAGRADKRATDAAIGAGIGVLAGAGVGHLVRTEVWTKLNVASLRF
jgi:hypothetical protein